MSRNRPLISALMQNLLVGYANGKQLKQMAQERYVSYSTATQAVGEAKKRLKAKNLAQAVIKAQALGFISGPTGAEAEVFPLSP